MWKSAQWRAVCTETAEADLSAFVYRLFREDFSSLVRTGRVKES